MKTISTLLVSTLLIASIFARSKKSLNEYLLKYQLDTSKYVLIDKPILQNLIANTSSEITWVAIYTNLCSGTKYLNRNVNTIHRKYDNKVQILMCSSAPYKDVYELSRVLERDSINLNPVYMIDSKSYKDKWSDDREKGFSFRKDICEPCRNDIIGVPYSIFFNKKSEVVYYGYPSKTDIDSFLNVYLK